MTLFNKGSFFMKGIIIKQGVQFHCELQGENWRQGEQILGSLELLGSSYNQDLNIRLAIGQDKKVSKKDVDAFEILEEVNLERPGQFSFQLPANAFLSEKSKSLYLLFGGKDFDFPDYGSLRLEIRPEIVIEEFLGIFVDQMRFKLKSCKSKIRPGKPNTTEAKLEAPEKGDYQNIDSLTLHLSFIESEEGKKQLSLNYQFTLKKLAYGEGDMAVKKEKYQIMQNLSEREFLFYGKDPHLENYRKHIELALEEVKSKKQF